MKITEEMFYEVKRKEAEAERQRKEDIKNHVIPPRPATWEDSVALSNWQRFIRGGAAGLFLNTLLK